VTTESKEDVYAEQPTLQWLDELGWEVEHGPDFGPGGASPERDTWRDVVLIGRLRSAVAGLNPELPEDAVEYVVQQVLTTTSPNVIEDHAGFHRMLVDRVPVTYADADGLERTARAKIVDFEDPEQNDFLALNQFTVIYGSKNRRPDVLLLVNGIPLGQVELKNPADGTATPEAAANQVAHYAETIPPLYRFVEIVGVSDLLQARVGTISTPAEHFAEWKAMDAADSEQRSELEVMLRGAFSPEQLLDLVHNFVLFEVDAGKTTKVLAKYHQVDAVNRAVEATAEAMHGDGRAGVVWHTQGAGKSYSMVFYTQKLRRDARFRNPTIVCVTDRIDLDDQLMQTFAKQTELAQSVKQAEEVSGGRGSLHELLKVPAGGVVFTTIQKFLPPTGAKDMPVLSERENVIVVSDEAHRSQYADFARNLRKALPSATRIGFTGTPIEKENRSTSLTFGDYISVYRMRQSQEDQATVPIYYESRQIPVAVEHPEALRQVEEVLEGEEEAARSKLVTSWAKLEKVVGSPERIERLAGDVAEHFRARCETLAGKGMVVAYSRRIAAELTHALRQRLGTEVVDCVISAQATDPPELSRFRRSKAELKQLAKDFRAPDHPLRMVVVKDMWLTGFDAPVLHTLYVDKPMRDHGLLQAIARVNRVFRDKPGGLVVDYIGVGDDLRASLQAYDEADVDEPMIPAARAVAGLWEKYEVLAAMLHPAGYRPRELHLLDTERLFQDAFNYLLATDERTRQFLDVQTALARWYAMARTERAALELRDEIGFFNQLAGAVRKITTPSDQASKEAEQAVRQFFSAGLAAGEVLDVLAIADKDRPELSVLSDEFLDSITERSERPNIQVRLLEKLLKDEVRAQRRRNATQAQIFSEKLSEVLHRYELRQLTSAEVVERLVSIAKELRSARRRHEQLGLSEEEAAFYDALAGGSDHVEADPKLATIAHELVEGIRNDLSVDWADRESTEAKIRTKIKRLLRRHGYPPPTGVRGGGRRGGSMDGVTDAVLGQAKMLYRYWPEVGPRDARLFA
jgi:type I restriction enzyme R subunit